MATSVSDDVHAPPESPLLLNVLVPVEQIACVPLSVPALGSDVTVIVPVALILPHPPVKGTL